MLLGFAVLYIGAAASPVAGASSLPSPLQFPNGTGNVVTFGPFIERLTARIPDTFLSFNFDWNKNTSAGDAWTNASLGWTLDLQDPRLRALASALAPANLRVGGSSADVAQYAGFGHGGRTSCDAAVIEAKFCLSPARFDELVASGLPAFKLQKAFWRFRLSEFQNFMHEHPSISSSCG